jgi:pilus assembly protein CpaF
VSLYGLRDRVIPFLRPLEAILLDPDVTEVMVNAGGTAVFLEKHGRLRHVPDITIDAKALTVAIRNIARGLGGDFSEAEPILDARLEDGSRVSAVSPPVAVDGATLTIRRFGHRYTVEQLVREGMLPRAVAADLCHELHINLRTVLIAGGTGTGKTTLLNALADTLPSGDRVVLLEDTAEIHLERDNLVRFATVASRPSAPGHMSASTWGPNLTAAVTMTDLLRTALRHRPDRIIVGEVRGAEAFDLLQALNTGHQGSLSTIHANSAVEALSRFAFLVQMAGVAVPFDTVCAQIAATGLVVVYVTREDGRRVVAECAQVVGYVAGRGWDTVTVYLSADERITPSAGRPAAMGVLDGAKGGAA